MARPSRVAHEDDRKHLIYTGSLLAIVVGTLVLGAALRADPDSPGRESAGLPIDADGVELHVTTATDLAPPAAPGEPVEDETRALGLPFHGDADLADRAAEDERRLYASGDGFTLQFAVVCKPENARGTLEELAGRQRFFLLTTLLDDRVCFRLCWGIYDSERQALAARDAPEALRRITGQPKVLSVSEALP